jgi:hypothetical protein
MPLDQLLVFGNPLTSLEPFVDNPPPHFSFDCDSLPDAELVRVRDIWSKRPGHRQHAQDAGILLAMRHRDLPALQHLAATFHGHRYLLTPREATWETASEICRALGGRLVTIRSAEENAFVAGICRDTFRPPWIGMRRDAGQLTWENGGVVSSSLMSTRGDPTSPDVNVHAVFVHDGWLFPSLASKMNPFIIEWDHE